MDEPTAERYLRGEAVVPDDLGHHHEGGNPQENE